MKDQARHSGQPSELVGKYWIALDENGIVCTRTSAGRLELVVLTGGWDTGQALSHLICPCVRGRASQVEAL